MFMNLCYKKTGVKTLHVTIVTYSYEKMNGNIDDACPVSEYRVIKILIVVVVVFETSIIF